MPSALEVGQRIRFEVTITGSIGVGKVGDVFSWSPYPYKIEWERKSDGSRMIQQFNLDCFSQLEILEEEDAQTQS